MISLSCAIRSGNFQKVSFEWETSKASRRKATEVTTKNQMFRFLNLYDFTRVHISHLVYKEKVQKKNFA